MTIQAILFDADGVIQTAPKNRQERLLALLPRHSNVDKFIHELFEEELSCIVRMWQLEGTPDLSFFSVGRLRRALRRY